MYEIIKINEDKERGSERGERGRDVPKRGREREELSGEDEAMRRKRRQQVRVKKVENKIGNKDCKKIKFSLSEIIYLLKLTTTSSK